MPKWPSNTRLVCGTGQSNRRLSVNWRTSPIIRGALSLRRSRVMHANRMEVIGFGPNDLPALKAGGCFTEVISWKTRLFVPVGSQPFGAEPFGAEPFGAEPFGAEPSAGCSPVLDALLREHRAVASPEIMGGGVNGR